MQYQISSDNIQISPSMVALAKKKFSKIATRLKNVPEELALLRIVMNKAPDDKFVVKAHVATGKNEYFSDEVDFSLETAMISTVEELLRMMEKDKKSWKKGENKVLDEIIPEEEIAP